MQHNSKPSQKRNSLSARPRHSVHPVFAQARVTILDSLDLKLSAAELAQDLIKRATASFLDQLRDALTLNFYLAEIKSARRERAQRAQLRLPGFEHLPLRIPGPKGTPILLRKASYTRVRAYYRSLTTGYDARKRSDPRIQEAKALMDKMQRHAARDKAITVQQMLLLEA